jgi:hypothetical protein
MHTVLTALSHDERDAVSAALARALDEVQAIVGARLAAERIHLEQPTTLTS